MPLTDQLYYLAVGYWSLYFDRHMIAVMLLFVLVVVVFVVMLCRMARRSDND